MEDPQLNSAPSSHAFHQEDLDQKATKPNYKLLHSTTIREGWAGLLGPKLNQAELVVVSSTPEHEEKIRKNGTGGCGCERVEGSREQRLPKIQRQNPKEAGLFLIS
jgi:hypothetical protein